MATVKINYDKKGRIINVKRPPIFATSKKVDRIEAHTEFDSKDYAVSIAIKRSDGIVLGSYSMSPSFDVNGKIYHFYMLDEEDTRVSGPLQLTIRYEVIVEDELSGELNLVQSKPMSMTEIYIYESVEDAHDKLGHLIKRLDYLEKQIGEIPENINAEINEIKLRINDLEEALGEAGTKIITSKDAPLNLKEGDFWFEIL